MGKTWVLKNLRLKAREEGKDEVAKKNIKTMKEFAWKQMEASLIEEKALEDAIYYSGGVFRVFMDLIYGAGIGARVAGKEMIGIEEMKVSVQEEKISLTRTLNQSHWEILLEVERNKDFLVELDSKRLEFLPGLFDIGIINAEKPYGINPLLENKFQRYKKRSQSNQ